MENKFKNGDLVKIKGREDVLIFGQYGGGAYYRDDEEDDKLVHATLHSQNSAFCRLVKIEDIEVYKPVAYVTTQQVKEALGVDNFRIVDPISEEEQKAQEESKQVWDKRLSPSKYYPVQPFKEAPAWPDKKLSKGLIYDEEALLAICDFLGNTYLDAQESSGENILILMHSPKKKLMGLTIGHGRCTYSEDTINNLQDKKIITYSPRAIDENAVFDLLNSIGYKFPLFKRSGLADLGNDSMTRDSIGKCFDGRGGLSNLSWKDGKVEYVSIDLNRVYNTWLNIFPDGSLELRDKYWNLVKIEPGQVKCVQDVIKDAGYNFIN